jgi:hypothetical protein
MASMGRIHNNSYANELRERFAHRVIICQLLEIVSFLLELSSNEWDAKSCLHCPSASVIIFFLTLSRHWICSLIRSSWEVRNASPGSSVSVVDDMVCIDKK